MPCPVFGSATALETAKPCGDDEQHRVGVADKPQTFCPGFGASHDVRRSETQCERINTYLLIAIVAGMPIVV